ncbi:MAG: AbrB/MazE/SpoVT family DNA-binding domain-containing protein [Dehalococcoidia bacterium]|jgi:AbrB family looped-hinge helix DNA binding protein
MTEYTATVTLDKQKRVTIPKSIRDKEELKPGDVIEVVIRTIGETKGNGKTLCSA